MTSVGGGGKQPPGLMFPKYCKKFIGAQNMPIHLITYIFNRGVDASKTNLLKKALSESISTQGKLKNMPDHGGNRTYDLLKY